MHTLKWLQGILYVLTTVGMLIEIVQMISKKHKYLISPQSYVEITLYVCVFFFIQTDGDECWCAEGWIWQLGAFGCCLAWLNLVIILKRLPFTAIPINMLLSILWTFFTVSLLPLLLILAFALPLFLLLSRPGVYTPFRSFAQSCIKTLVMTTGEFEFDQIFLFNSSSDSIFYPPATYIIWIFFIILMPVLFNNLLVALAVGDIQYEREKANLTKLLLQVDLALSVEETLTPIRRFWYKVEATFHSAKHNIPVLLLRRLFTSTLAEKSEAIKKIKVDEKLRNLLIGVSAIDPMDEIKNILEKQENENNELKEAVKSVQDKCDKQEATLMKILSTVESYQGSSSRLHSNSVKSVRYRLKKAERKLAKLPMGVSSTSIDDGSEFSSFPLLPQ